MKKQGGRQKKGLLGLIGLTMVITLWTIKDHSIGNATAADPMTTQEHAEGNARLHSAMADLTALKHSLRDPSSLAVDRVLTSKIGDVVCIRYRARTGFGGMNRDGVVFADDVNGSSNRRTWRKRCMHGGLIDLTDEVDYAVEVAGR